MPTRPEITITKEELERAEIPLNHVLIKITRRVEGLTTRGGVTIGFNTDTVYAEGDDSHSANLAENIGYVVKVPKALYFNPDDPKSMDWETEMELQIGDQVWFSLIEAKNSVQLICEDVLYKSCPYSDIYCYKREVWRDKWKGIKETVVGMLNGFVLCTPVYFERRSHLDVISDTQIDKSKGIIAFIGDAPKAYIRPEYSHINRIEVGDKVLFDPKTPLFFLERLKATSQFQDGKQFWVVARRRIVMVISR
jgi:hypothetical protein